jgi:hypothetical protein
MTKLNYRVFDNDRYKVLAYFSDQKASFETEGIFGQIHVKLSKRSIEVLNGLNRKFAKI